MLQQKLVQVYAYLLSQIAVSLLRSLLYAHICCEQRYFTCPKSTQLFQSICKGTVIYMALDCMGTLKTDVSMPDCRL